MIKSEIVILDSKGKEVHAEVLSGKVQFLSLNTENLASGNYIYVIKDTSGEVKTGKFEIIH